MGWFPLPDTVEDVELLAPCGQWTSADVFQLLTDPSAELWRDKVGVAGPLDGSAKSTTRLLAARGWVCKTRVDERWESQTAARVRCIRSRAAGLAAGVWHPDKTWAIVRSAEHWLVFTLCPQLTTLRQIEQQEQRLLAWIEMLQLSINVYREHRLGLDVNPANFGRTGGVLRAEAKLFYLDDEFYGALGERELAGAIVARIPEEPNASSEVWAHWGSLLAQRLDFSDFSWERVRDEILRYPLSETFTESRSALLNRLPREPSRGRRGSASRGLRRMICVLSDVHANQPALEAVLADAQSRGADSFLFLGDAVGYGPHPAECIRLLANLEHAVFIRGNHDHAIGTGQLELGMNSLARQCAQWTRDRLGHSELAWLLNLPVEYGEENWLAVHGAPQDPRRFMAYVYDLTYEDNFTYLEEQRISICFHGHTHLQLTHVERDLSLSRIKLTGEHTLDFNDGHRYLVNPGSVGQPRDGDSRAAYALWNRRERQLCTVRVPYDLEQTIAAVRFVGLPSQIELRLRQGA